MDWLRGGERHTEHGGGEDTERDETGHGKLRLTKIRIEVSDLFVPLSKKKKDALVTPDRVEL